MKKQTANSAFVTVHSQLDAKYKYLESDKNYTNDLNISMLRRVVIDQQDVKKMLDRHRNVVNMQYILVGCAESVGGAS